MSGSCFVCNPESTRAAEAFELCEAHELRWLEFILDEVLPTRMKGSVR